MSRFSNALPGAELRKFRLLSGLVGMALLIPPVGCARLQLNQQETVAVAAVAVLAAIAIANSDNNGGYTPPD